MRNMIRDILILLTLAAGAAACTLLFHPKMLVSAALFFLVPAVYLHLKKRFKYRRILAATLTFSLSLAAIDVLMSTNNGWILPHAQMMVLPGLFGFWSLDSTIWSIFYTFYLLSFYEYFLDHDRTDKLSRNFRPFLLLPLGVTLVVGLLLALTPPLTAPIVPYAYAVLFTVPTLLPLALLILRGRNVIRLLGKFSLVAAFFFVVNLLHELSALATNQWYFTGQYVGIVSLLGFSFPIEEFLYYVSISAFTFLACYELFVDDGK